MINLFSVFINLLLIGTQINQQETILFGAQAITDSSKSVLANNRVPLLKYSPYLPDTICPVRRVADGYVVYEAVVVPGGEYRLKIDVRGRVAEYKGPSAHTILRGADRSRPLVKALDQIPFVMRRMRFTPAHSTDGQPVEAWVTFKWPIIDCPKDIRRRLFQEKPISN